MRKLLLALMGVVWLAPLVQSSPLQRGRSHENPPVFTEADRRVILDYYRTDTRNLPPGLAKRHGNLPPGLEKQLQRNGQLPPGLQKRVTSFPPVLDRRLPRLPSVWRRGVIGNQAIIYDSRTRAIADVLDIFAGR